MVRLLCLLLAVAWPAWVSGHTLDETINVGRSVDGRTIEARVWSLAEGVDECVLILASIHGSEPAGTPLVGRFEAWLAEQDAATLPATIVIVPIANPDGYARRERFNSNGVDLNRNFPAGNRTEKAKHGEAALSEPESAALMRVLTRFAPSRVLSLHQPIECIDYDGPGEALAEAMARAIDDRLPVKKLGGRPGSLGSYVGQELGRPIITLELPKGAEAGSDADGGAELWRLYGEAVIAFVRGVN
ncbi:MAG: DUF2817 domain-containing protein [Planctomycetota bacterium]